MTLYMTREEASGMLGVGVSVRETSPLLRALELWRMQSREDLAVNCVYFQALDIMLQIPGSAQYVYATANDKLQNLRKSRPEKTLDLFAATLERLGAPELIKQIPGRRDYQPRPLSARRAKLLAKRDHNGLLNVAAECPDALMVRPGIKLADKQPKCVWPSVRPATKRRCRKSDAVSDE